MGLSECHCPSMTRTERGKGGGGGTGTWWCTDEAGNFWMCTECVGLWTQEEHGPTEGQGPDQLNQRGREKVAWSKCRGWNYFSSFRESESWPGRRWKEPEDDENREKPGVRQKWEMCQNDRTRVGLESLHRRRCEVREETLHLLTPSVPAAAFNLLEEFNNTPPSSRLL